MTGPAQARRRGSYGIDAPLRRLSLPSLPLRNLRPLLPLNEQKWGGLRWASLPPVPERHCSGKVAIVGHTPQNGQILDLGYLKCIDTFCHGGGWLSPLQVEGGRRVWQANEAREVRVKGVDV